MNLKRRVFGVYHIVFIHNILKILSLSYEFILTILNISFYVILLAQCSDNFVILYELFDEMMDYGYPQVSDEKVLKE